MKKHTYYLCLILVSALTAIFLAVGIVLSNMYIPVATVVGAIAILAACRSRITDITEDELSASIHGKAALNTLEVVIVIAAVGFAASMIMYSTIGTGTTMNTPGLNSENQSITISSMLIDQNSHVIFHKESYRIENPTHMTIDDAVGLENMFSTSSRMRSFPYEFGRALGLMAIILGIVYGAFSLYYNKKYEM